MKVSKLIENLEYLKKTYGDLEVSINLDEDEEGEVNCSELFFATDLEFIYIDNTKI